MSKFESSQDLRKVATYKTQSREVEREYFDVHKRARQLDPSDEEMFIAHYGSVMISTMEESPRKVDIPSPEDIITDHLGVDPKGESQVNSVGDKNVDLLRFTYKLYEHISKDIDEIVEVTVPCQICSNTPVLCRIGRRTIYDEGIVVFSDIDALISMSIRCTCKFNLDNILEIERIAINQ